MTISVKETNHLAAHGGNLRALACKAGCAVDEILDFSASINPLGPPEELRQIISRSVGNLACYPDPHAGSLLAHLAGILGVEKDQLLAANGSTEIIYALPRALDVKRAVVPVPSYSDYRRAAELAGLKVLSLPLVAEDGFRVDFAALAGSIQNGDLVFLGRPNNPTGVSFAHRDLLELVDKFPGIYFAVDESFYEFIEGESGLISKKMVPNLIVFRSLTKFYAIPGLRLGFAVAAPEVAARLREQILPWTVNGIAQAVGEKIVGDPEYGAASRGFIEERRNELFVNINNINCLSAVKGDANFLLIRLQAERTAQELADRLLKNHRIAIRVCENFSGLDDTYFRVAVRSREDNDRLCAALTGELVPGRQVGKKARGTPALMLQGTSSNAGKSVLTAALCRIFLQDGYNVAPFKAQNMSLNSFVTRKGEEMGRAQVVQAQACRLDPDVRMNPVLLKPSSDVGCQVIVNGFPIGNMKADNYIRYKNEARVAAHAAYDSLAAEHDLIILEGAGSPAEVNLKKHDIVNMGMARHAGSPVLLVGDIDRGGVFASFIGTMEVMAEWERKLIAGFVVNRFRGLESLLDDAFRYTEEFTGRPVLGTVPYVRNLGLPEEDSVSFKGGLYDQVKPSGDHVTIGLIDLPHISNFTDVEPFLAEPDVHLRIIRTASELVASSPELSALILPGSKNVISDLAYLRKSGLADRITALAGERTLDIIGICGGFQMLGTKIGDPHKIESDGGEIDGLGLLEVITTLAPEKTLTRQTALHLPSHLKVHGYEIHHGRTSSTLASALRFDGGGTDGAVSPDGRIWGSYLHGIFDDDPFRRWFIDMLRSSRCLQPLGTVVAPYDLEPAFDRLAAVVREGMDMKKIYRILGLR
ncbi:MAG: cobyric acid synthase [Proteobacteria bacterium]|nr:cobyric acid synthase [Pseudomonadota bacterium]MBU1739528.1 cobyric acid synthase [Pseudomonadota bacterium]